MNGKQFRGFVIRKTNKIVLQISHKGYDTTYVSVVVPEMQYGEPVRQWDTRLKVNLNRTPKMRNLKEATVTASKVMMVMRGDTVVFNASAFMLSEGTMLDGLIAKIPNMKIDRDGRISVNGQFVSTLLVNGRDFYNGNAQVALRNLPSYTVKELAVYRKLTKDMELRGDTAMHKRPLVMDVRLKREYMKSWVSNYEVAGGTRLGGWNDVWMGRFFALRNTKQSTLSFYGNANNLNDAQSPEVNGDWRKLSLYDGEKTTWLGGAFLNVEGSKNPWKTSTTIEGSRQSVFNEERSYSESYYATGDVRSRNSRQNDQRNVALKMKTKLEREWRGSSMSVNANGGYTHSNRHGESLSERFALHTNDVRDYYARQGSDDMLNDLLYQRLTTDRSHSYSWNGEFFVTGSARLPWDGNFLMAQVGGNVDNRVSTSWNTDRVNYAGSANAPIDETKFYDTPSRHYRYFLTAYYSPSCTLRRLKSPVKLMLTYNYSQEFRSNHRLLQMADTDGAEADMQDDVLPSVYLSNKWLTDLKNSFHTTQLEREQSFTPELTYRPRKGPSWTFRPKVLYAKRHINDERSEKRRSLTTHNVFLEPELYSYFRKENQKRRLFNGNIRFAYDYDLPTLTDLLDVNDDSDPLYRSLGNPDLKIKHTFSGRIGMGVETRGTYDYKCNFTVNTQYIRNAYAMARTYDAQTGVTSVMPQNINGNRTWVLENEQSVLLDKQRRWWLQNKLEYRNRRTVDFNSYSSVNAYERMIVRSHIVDDRLRLDYHLRSLTLTGKADVKWTRQLSDEASFRNQQFTDFSYGLALTTPLVWGFDFDTDLTVFCRRGYSEASYNTTEWVWNATLTRALGHKKLWAVKLQGCDILHQLSNVRRDIGPTGLSETWYNTIPSYVTLHVIFKLHGTAKKQ